MPDIVIDQVQLSDMEKLQIISRQTFYETFAAHNTPEDMQQYLDENLSLQQLGREWQQPGSAFYFARHHQAIIGFLKVNTGQAQTELKDPRSLEIERIYVLKEFQGLKLGQLLYDKAVEIARQKKLGYIWLGVWEKNTKAIGFYEKNGFTAFDKHVFKLGNDEQTDIMMKRML